MERFSDSGCASKSGFWLKMAKVKLYIRHPYPPNRLCLVYVDRDEIFEKKFKCWARMHRLCYPRLYWLGGTWLGGTGYSWIVMPSQDSFSNCTWITENSIIQVGVAG